MEYQIKPESPPLLWLVRCLEAGRVVETHRFYTPPGGWIYHRGPHGEHELAAQSALEEYLKTHPDQAHHDYIPPENQRKPSAS